MHGQVWDAPLSSCRPFPCIPCICRMIDGRVNFIGIWYRCRLSSSVGDYDTFTSLTAREGSRSAYPVPSRNPVIGRFFFLRGSNDGEKRNRGGKCGKNGKKERRGTTLETARRCTEKPVKLVASIERPSHSPRILLWAQTRN